MSAAQLRKIKKPLIEKKRRERMNCCLNQLKSLVLEGKNTNSNESRYSKMEKVDILEMTVRYLKEMRHSQSPTCAASINSFAAKYIEGYSECANQVGQYLSSAKDLNEDTRQRINHHIASSIRNTASAARDSGCLEVLPSSETQTIVPHVTSSSTDTVLTPIPTSGYQCSPLTTSGYQCSPLSTSGYQCSTLSTSGYQCSPLSNSGYQCSTLPNSGYQCSTLFAFIPKVSPPGGELFGQCSNPPREIPVLIPSSVFLSPNAPSQIHPGSAVFYSQPPATPSFSNHSTVTANSETVPAALLATPVMNAGTHLVMVAGDALNCVAANGGPFCSSPRQGDECPPVIAAVAPTTRTLKVECKSLQNIRASLPMSLSEALNAVRTESCPAGDESGQNKAVGAVWRPWKGNNENVS